MGEASRTQDHRTMLERMPWRGKFTPEQVRIIDKRRARVVDAMTDAVGLFGQVMYVDPAQLELLAAHVALAGDFFDDGHGRFIEWRLRDVEANGEVVFKDIREWRKVGEFGDEPAPDPSAVRAEAQELRDAMLAKLTPDVRRALTELLVDEIGNADRDVTKREKAEGLLAEQQLRDMREDSAE